jgi:hypothetical protein
MVPSVAVSSREVPESWQEEKYGSKGCSKQQRMPESWQEEYSMVPRVAVSSSEVPESWQEK